ncbi:hypothetical protein [Salana multivorans]
MDVASEREPVVMQLDSRQRARGLRGQQEPQPVRCPGVVRGQVGEQRLLPSPLPDDVPGVRGRLVARPGRLARRGDKDRRRQVEGLLGEQRRRLRVLRSEPSGGALGSGGPAAVPVVPGRIGLEPLGRRDRAGQLGGEQDPPGQAQVVAPFDPHPGVDQRRVPGSGGVPDPTNGLRPLDPRDLNRKVVDVNRVFVGAANRGESGQPDAVAALCVVDHNDEGARTPGRRHALVHSLHDLSVPPTSDTDAGDR